MARAQYNRMLDEQERSRQEALEKIHRRCAAPRAAPAAAAGSGTRNRSAWLASPRVVVLLIDGRCRQDALGAIAEADAAEARRAREKANAAGQAAAARAPTAPAVASLALLYRCNLSRRERDSHWE